jgi:probable rRNA maturation factor
MTMSAPAQRLKRRFPTRRVSPRSERRAGSEIGAPAANPSVTIRNRQRTRAVDLRLLRAVVRGLFNELPLVEEAELGVFLVAAPEMTRLNETLLHHAGSTDVITFDYADHASRITHHAVAVHGEIFICVDEAIAQARRFRTNWQSEIVRYVVHGVLHLLGHDDRRGPARRKMKSAENQLLRALARQFDFPTLAAPPPRRPPRKS